MGEVAGALVGLVVVVVVVVGGLRFDPGAGPNCKQG